MNYIELIIPYIKYLIFGAVALFCYTKGKEHENEKQRRIQAEDQADGLKKEKQYDASRIARAESSRDDAKTRNQELLERLAKIDIAHLTDDERAQLSKDPYRFAELYSDPQSLQEPTDPGVRKGRRED